MSTSPQHFVPKVESYEADDAQKIIDAYREIFPSITPDLAKYWGLDRSRPWSWLASDFHAAAVADYQAFSEAVAVLDHQARTRPMPADDLARRMIAICKEHGLGFSIGPCPWTDHALHRTYGKSPDRQLVVLVGHDWYPIVPKRVREPHPLSWPMRQDGLHRMAGTSPRAELYYCAVSQALLSGNCGTLLFLDIYPDYRAPEENAVGPVQAGYEGCLEGFEALLAATRPHYRPEDVTIVSWGSMPWELLKQRTDVRRPGSIMAITEQLAGSTLELKTRQAVYRYLPLAHPSEARNFQIDFHLEHVRTAFERMGWGKPLGKATPRKRPSHWSARTTLQFASS
jgi:hypothetical protein